MARQDKIATVERVSTRIDESGGLIFLDYTGATVEDANGFRRTLQKESLGYEAVKNTLVARALMGKPFEALGEQLKGSPTGVVFADDDIVSAAKITLEFLKGCPRLKVKAGVVEGKILDDKGVEALSKMKSKAETQAEIVGLALSPGRNIAGQVKNPSGRIVGAIEALQDRLGG